VSRRSHALLLAVGAIALLALALSLTSVAAPAKRSDVAATRSYLVAELAANEALESNERQGVVAGEELAASITRACPGVAAKAPEGSSSAHELRFEAGYAAVLAYLSPIRAKLQTASNELAQLRWSNRRLTTLVRYQVLRDRLIGVSPPDLCGDYRTWAASGYKNVPTGTSRFLAQTGPTVVASTERLAKHEAELIPTIERLLRPYEGRSERLLQRRVDHLRTLWRSQPGLEKTVHTIEMVLGLHALGQEGQGAPLIEPPLSVVQADGKRLEEFYLGRKVVAQSGCLACHRIGEYGNSGPGPDLTHIASKLTGTQIARALINPTAPMPSFRRLPKAKFEAVVEFLSLLH
jgi:mono/diheme cytochrome c family protein